MVDLIFLNPPLSLKDLYEDLSEGGSELPPLGIATLASVCRSSGLSVDIIDSMALRLDPDETVQKIISLSPKFVGISSTTLSIMNAAQVAEKLKAERPDIVTIMGGAHITAVPEETMRKFPDIDIGVIGEGEDTLLDLLNTLSAGKTAEEVAGIIYRDNGEIIRTKPREFITDLDRLPLPAWDLLPDLVEHYQPAADSLYRSPASSLVTSRGCPGQCKFCDRSVFGNRIRGFSAPYVVEMIKTLRTQYGIRDLFIHDDNFIVFRKRLKEICEIIIDQNIDITWSCLGRIDHVEPDLLPLMKKAGCWQMNLGIESGSQRILDIIGKKTRIEQVEQVIRTVRKAGIRVKGLFMIANFGETEESIHETLDFIRRVPMDDFHMTCFTPFPGTEAFELAPTYGTFNPSWEATSMFTADNFIPHGLTRDLIEKYYRKAYRTFYLRPSTVFYYLKKFRDPRMAVKIIRATFAFLKFTREKNTVTPH